MESFYGGKSGASFVIVKSFSSEAEMIAKFKLGGDYTEVHYDEYILINTRNKNDKTNGNVYRRGYNYQNSIGGAIYIGTIVGPAGKAPMLELTTIADVEDRRGSEGEERYSSGSYNTLNSLVPGKNKDGTFNDAIEWACCSVRDINGEDTTAYIGFKFPYLIEEFTATSVSPYYNRDDVKSHKSGFKNTDLIKRTDDETHPYYESWHFSVPQGIKGDTFKNFRVMTADSTIVSYNGQEDDIKNKRQVLVYDYYHYDKEEDGEPTTIYLGDYNMIKDISLDEHGTITIYYSHDDTKEYNQLLKWIDKVELNSTTGHFKVTYNNVDENGNPVVYETDLAWVKSLSIAADGKITLHYTGGKADEVLTNTHLRWIDNIVMDTDGTVTVNYNDGTSDSFDKKIKWITNVSLTDAGVLTIDYNNGDASFTKQLKWVTNVTVASDGTITIIYNNGTSTVCDDKIKYIDKMYFGTDNKFHVVYNDKSDEPIDNKIKFISKVYIEDDKETDGDYLFHVVYNTGEDEAFSTQPTNYIENTVIDTVDYHFLVYYSNANYRKKFIADGVARTYNGQDGWLDLGSIKDDSGVLVGFNLVPSEHPDDNIGVITDALKYLDANYSGGLTDPMVKGKIITIGESGVNKNFYAYDYNSNKWYYLGTFDNDNIWTMMGREDDATLDSQKSKLAIGGIWFIVEGEDD
jgi:hypothetical protein